MTTNIGDMPRDLKRWEVRRQKGKAHFVLVFGVLTWGVPMFLLKTCVADRVMGHVHSDTLNLAPAVIWLSAGALFGLVVWSLSERKYRKFIATRSS